MNISEAATHSGISSKMIRHYESIGLIEPPQRTASGYRTYTGRDLHELRFIKTARSLGFPLEEIKLLLSLWRDKNRSSADVKALVMHHITTLEQKITEMTAMRDTLQTLARHCQGDQRPDCPILSRLEQTAVGASGDRAGKRKPGAGRV